ncbi:MAG TPA: LysR family transcriptional regulator [Solirubrobacterales bacterium]|nr:LysR family transcriptional regulator [Solirubrobacterales bacterium]
MTLQQLRYFLAACEAGSFTAAADRLYVAQPSLAQQVRRLEDELGVRLFVRAGRRLRLTEAGTLLRENAERVIAALEATEAAVRETRELRQGTASLGTFGLAQRYLVGDVVSAFVARHPDVAVRVVGSHSLEVVEKVRAGELEAGLVALPVEGASLEVEPVMSDELLFVSRPEAESQAPVSIQHLAEARLIAWPAVAGWRDSIRGKLRARAGEEGVELEPAVEVEHLESALDLASLGLGVTYVPRTIAESPGFPAALATQPFARPLYETYAFVRRSDHRLSPATAELVRLAREQMEGFGMPVVEAD